MNKVIGWTLLSLGAIGFVVVLQRYEGLQQGVLGTVAVIVAVTGLVILMHVYTMRGAARRR